MKKATLLILLAALSLIALKAAETGDTALPVPIPPSTQRSGDAARGYAYLVTGDYLKSGIPYAFFKLMGARDRRNFLQRDGDNEDLAHDFTAVNAPNGETVVAPNCLQCHAQEFDGKLVIGLGNSLADFTGSQRNNAVMAERMLRATSPKRYAAAKNFLTAVRTVSPDLVTDTRGVNMADVLAALLVAHRDPVTLAWSDRQLLPLPAGKIPSDVPAWWLLKKKNAMFYNGFGRGDFGRFLMASNLLTVSDTVEAASVDRHFNDVLAYINSLEAPRYPKPVDTVLAGYGRALFNSHCNSCHGTYGDNGQYPNLLIPESIIQTDSLLYASNYSSPQFVDWFNKSWFTTGDHPAQLVPYHGYIAPPLDGVWITAPYLHNGSVPNLETLLNSGKRPKYWKRDFNTASYRYDIPGWQYEIREAPGGSDVYNTTAPGLGNYGHTFGDQLSDRERSAVIEYLKTL